jgi:L-ribulokinase
VVAGKSRGGHESFDAAQAAMCGIKPRSFRPNRANHRIYGELYRLYARVHDAFGTAAGSGSLYNVMKDLLTIRDRQRKNG